MPRTTTRNKPKVTRTRKSNGESAEVSSRGHVVGSVVELPADHYQPIQQLAQRLGSAQRQLGQHRTTFLRQEQQLANEIFHMAQEYTELIKMTGLKLGLNIEPGSGEQWVYDEDRAVFERKG